MTADSLYFSFGAEPFSVTDTTSIVGVEIVGSPCEYDREYRIALDAEHTTARQGDHYDALREPYAAGERLFFGWAIRMSTA